MSDETTDRPAKPVAPFSTPEMVAIEADITATRAQLAASVDELAARLDPRAQAGRALESGRQLWSDATGSDAEPAARKRALTVLGGVVAGAAAFVGLAVLMFGRRRGD